MEIISRLDGDEMRIALRGRLDAAWSGSVNQSLQDAVHSGNHRIALDLSAVDYLSSAGIRVLVMLAKSLNSIGGALRLVDASPAVSDVLKLVGFQQLLDSFTSSAPPPAANRGGAAETVATTMTLAGAVFDVYTLDAQARQRGAIIEPNAAGPVSITVSAQTWAIGHGLLGDNRQLTQAGELIAAAGLAIGLPGGDPQHPDWLTQQRELVPKVGLLHGLTATGPFRYLLRFGYAPDLPPLRLSELAAAALAVCGSDAVSWVIAAETAHLIGAALQVPPLPVDDQLFAFPAIRDRLLFTAEPAYAEESCVLAGVVARNPSPKLARQLRPVAEHSPLALHVHAAVVPFTPIRKGLIDIPETLERLLDNQIVRGVLHLLNDDREGIGAGESYLRRGALWCAPVQFDDEDSA